MAALPESLPLSDVQGAALPTTAPAPTDFGLDRASAELERGAVANRRANMFEARAQARADAQSVMPDVMKLREANAQQFAADAAQWNGTPGFASDQVAAYTDRAQRFADNNPNYTEGQRAQFKRLADQITTAQGDQAVQHEQTVLLQNGIDQQEVGKNNALTGFMQGF